jgi:fido (protein-threonine AMPylation protein)
MCPIKGKNGIENYADSFAAALLMPLFEIKNQARRYKSGKFVSFSDALSIADYFGVSFQSCVLRLAYVLKVIDGDTEIGVLNKRIRSFSPSKKRTKQGLYDNYLYKTLIDALYPWIVIPENAHIKLKFENDYIYNDSRIEGIEIEKEKLAEIVTDIRLKGSKSDYCDYTHEAEISIAGHAEMYERVFSWPREKDISAFATLGLNQLLFSKAPEPDYGGRIRQSNTLVIGAKFETVDFADIPLKLAELNIHVKDLLEKIDILTPSQFIERSVRIHHQLTVIHPFPDGNGRTSRAFLNLLLSRKGLPAIYIKTEGKDKYLSALSIADENSEFAFLEIEICKAILRSICELSDYSILH